jgi:hypothetical protein
VKASWFAFDVAAIVLALAVKVLTPPAAWVERHYSNGIYPPIDRAIRAITAPVPFSVGDVLLLAVLGGLAWWWFQTIRRARGGPGATIVRLLVRTLAVGCGIFVWFVVSWAYNYSRIPLAEKIPVHPERATAAAIATLADRAADELSRNAARAHREPLTDAQAAERLLPTFGATIRRLGDVASFVPPRVKPTIFQLFMERSGTTGFTDPWTHEVNLDATTLPFERPALYAHEWGHIAGFADESEANLIGALACINASDPFLRYSGWLLVWFNLPPDVHLTHRLSAQARADVLAIRQRYRRHVNPGVARAQELAYDRYLHANHVKAGYESYRLFIRWLTAADFDRSGLPVVAPSPQ